MDVVPLGLRLDPQARELQPVAFEEGGLAQGQA